MAIKRYAWIWVILIFAIAAFLSQKTTNSYSAKKTWVPVVDLPPGAIVSILDIQEGEGLIRQDEIELLAGKEEIVGKKLTYGVKKGYGITKNVLTDNGKYHSVSIPIQLANIALSQKLKIASLWIDYDQKKFPNKPPEKIMDNATVIDLLNNRGISIFNEKTDQRVPATAELYVPESMIETIKDKSQKGQYFLTNPYYSQFKAEEVKDK